MCTRETNCKSGSVLRRFFPSRVRSVRHVTSPFHSVSSASSFLPSPRPPPFFSPESTSPSSASPFFQNASASSSDCSSQLLFIWVVAWHGVR